MSRIQKGSESTIQMASPPPTVLSGEGGRGHHPPVPDPIAQERAKRRASALSLAYNVLFTAAKLVAALLTGSMSLLSEALHSATDIVASALAYVGVRAASAPPDERHPYGHGKIETLAGFGESILLFLMVLYLIGEGIHRLLQGVVLESLELGLAVMSLSTLTSLLIGQYVLRVGRRTRSLALLFERAAPDGRFLDQCGRPACPSAHSTDRLDTTRPLVSNWHCALAAAGGVAARHPSVSRAD
jgi:hypothetical protein